MPVYKIIIPLFAGLMIYKWIYHLVKWNIEWREFWFSFIFWGIFAAIAIKPQLIDAWTKFTWIHDSVRAFFALIIMVLSFIIFRLILSIERIDRNFTKLIRVNALKKYNK